MAIFFAVLVATACTSCEDDSSGGGDDNYIITQAEYDQIQTGMSYEQVAAIIGSDGLLIWTTYSTREFEWFNGYPNMGKADVTFLNNGGVSSKSNNGLLP